MKMFDILIKMGIFEEWLIEYHSQISIGLKIHPSDLTKIGNTSFFINDTLVWSRCKKSVTYWNKKHRVFRSIYNEEE